MSLKLKVGAWLAATLMATLLLFALLVVRHERAQILDAAAEHVKELSDVVIRSTRFAMLNNQPAYVHSILEDVARQERIDTVRIYNKDGVIIDSTLAGEVGRRAGLAPGEKTRVFVAPDGRRMLASAEEIRNERSCWEAACHAHSRDAAVLGVLDISYPLDPMEASLNRSATTLVALSVAFVVVISVLVSFLVRRLVYVPLRDLEGGAQRLAQGNLDEAIPVRSADEFGRLARSFNGMTAALRHSREELREAARTLEQKVAERTRALRLAEAEAIRGEKLASVGLLAAGIAHELNNPLTGVLTFSSLLRKKAPEGSQDAEDLDLVIQETKRCAAIIRRLLDFSRDKAPEKKYADVNAVIEATVRIVEKPATLNDIEIVLDLDPQLPRAWVDADLVKQVIMNMLVNAQHAIDGRGRITLCTRRVERGVPMVEISIADTGCGIAEKDLPRIFDPFFTTKGVGKGTGLGLSVSHGIVEAHGGSIEVESAPGEGATFRVYLPVDPVVTHEAAA